MNSLQLERWREVWREGFAPGFTTTELRCLRDALEEDNHELKQGDTTVPPPLNCVKDWPVEEACVIGFCGWKGANLDLVGEVGEYFSRKCQECDDRLGEPAECRWFLNWFDDTPRDEMIPELLAEVKLALSQRG